MTEAASTAPLAQTPLHAWHAAHGGRLVDFAGWSMPVQYGSIAAEHTAVRTAAGLFDVSHMGRFRFNHHEEDGSLIAAFIDSVLTRRVTDTQAGQVRYSLVCNEAGGSHDDVLGYCGSSQKVVADSGILGLLTPTPVKIFVEYGVIVGLIVAGCLLFAYVGGPSRSLSVTMLVSLWMLQPGTTAMIAVLPLFITTTWWAPRFEPVLESDSATFAAARGWVERAGRWRPGQTVSTWRLGRRVTRNPAGRSRRSTCGDPDHECPPPSQCRDARPERAGQCRGGRPLGAPPNPGRPRTARGGR